MKQQATSKVVVAPRPTFGHLPPMGLGDILEALEDGGCLVTVTERKWFLDRWHTRYYGVLATYEDGFITAAILTESGRLLDEISEPFSGSESDLAAAARRIGEAWLAGEYEER